MPRRVALPLAVLTCAGMFGCVLPDQVQQIQKDLSDIRADVRRVQDEQQKNNAKLERIESGLSDRGDDAVTRTDFADLKLSLEDSTRQLAILGERVGTIERRVERVAGQVDETRRLTIELGSRAPGAVPPSTADPAAPGDETADVKPVQPDTPFSSTPQAVPDAEALFNAAYADYSKGNYGLAISGFEEFAERYEGTELADNAMYWIGECRFSQGDFDGAIEAFDDLLETYPATERAAAANLKKGLAYLEKNAISQAIVQLQHVVATYSASDEARIARDKLRSLGASAG